MNWCDQQQNYRFLWLGVILGGHGCILTPLTVIAVILAGTNMFLFVLAIVAMGIALVTNLAAMPTRITIPIFFLTILIDIVILISTLVIGFHAANALV